MSPSKSKVSLMNNILLLLFFLVYLKNSLVIHIFLFFTYDLHTSEIVSKLFWICIVWKKWNFTRKQDNNNIYNKNIFSE